MKIKEGFMIREIADQWIVVPVGARIVDFNGIMTLNESGAFLWKKLVAGAEETELMQALFDEYEMDEATIKEDLLQFIEEVRKHELLE